MLPALLVVAHLSGPTLLMQTKSLPNGVERCAISADGRYAAASDHNRLELLDIGAKKVTEEECPSDISELAFAGGDALAIFFTDGGIEFRTSRTWAKVRTLAMRYAVNQAWVTPDETHVFSSDSLGVGPNHEQGIALHDLANPSASLFYGGFCCDGVFDVSADGSKLFGPVREADPAKPGTVQEQLRVVALASGASTDLQEALTSTDVGTDHATVSRYSSVALSPDGTVGAAVLFGESPMLGTACTVQTYNLASGLVKRRFDEIHEPSLAGLAFSGDGRSLFVEGNGWLGRIDLLSGTLDKDTHISPTLLKVAREGAVLAVADFDSRSLKIYSQNWTAGK